VKAAPVVNVAAAVARARPSKVPPVTLMAAPARIAPRKFDVVSVAAALTHQYTLHGSPPFIITTLKLVPVRAPSASPSFSGVRGADRIN